MTARCSWVRRAACCNWKKGLAAALRRRHFPAPCALEQSKKLLVSSPLIEQLDAGRLDVVFAKRPLGTSRGRLVWREPMVWAAAETFKLVSGATLPLALYREHSVSRDAALIALRERELVWQIVYTSPSLTGVRAAALAGLAITPLPASAIVAGLRVLGVESGLPLLPDLEFAIFERKRPDAAAAALTAVLVSLGQTAIRPTVG